ncbi:MAG: PTS sugar transporter subunit IIA [Bacillota bacterium]|nr:PTS sugar transporter subunit IIA [Bacillota bacterium]
MNLAEIIKSDRIKLNMTATSKDEALKELTDLLYESGALSNKESFLEDVDFREKAGITGIGNGIAIPHGKSKFVKDTSVAIGLVKKGIKWDTIDDLPVKLIVLFAVNENDKTGMHVRLLSKMARKMANEEVCQRLVQASSPDEILQIFSGE